MPLQVAFPLLLSNLMATSRRDKAVEQHSFSRGNRWWFRCRRTLRRCGSRCPMARPYSYSPRTDRRCSRIPTRWACTASRSCVPALLHSNVRSRSTCKTPAESRVAPLRQLAIVQDSGQAVAVTTERNGRSEFWRWLAAIGLVVLVVEWLVYQRPAIALLRQRWRRSRTPTKCLARTDGPVSNQGAIVCAL